DTARLTWDQLDGGGNVLFEGAQGTLLDIDHGTYPFVTSSNPVSASACTGTGVGPKDIDEIWGIAKAYATRVGAGPFPTELDHDPYHQTVMHQATGDYERLPGWDEDISECRDETELPQAARDYLQFIADFVRVPVALIGVGPGRDQVIWTEAGRNSLAARTPAV